MTQANTSPSPNAFQKLKQHPLVLALLLLLVLGTCASGYLLFEQVVQKTQREQATENALDLASKLRLQANKYLADRQRQLTALSEKSTFLSAVDSGDPQQLQDAEKLLLEWAPELSAGFLLIPGDRRLIKQQHFAGQLLAEQTLAGEQPNPAAALIDKHWQLLFSYPVKDAQGEIKGAMLAAISPNALTELLKTTVNGGLGLTELSQNVSSGKHKPFLSLGSKAKALDVIDLPLSSNWQLHFSGSKQLLQNAQPSYGSFFLFLAILILAALVLGYLLVRITLHFHKDKAGKTKTKTKPKAAKIRDDEHASDPVNDSSESYLDIIPAKAGGKALADQAQIPLDTISTAIPEVVFRDYDIRGIAGQQLTPEFANRLGRTLAARALALGEHTLIVGKDGRQSSDELCQALEQGILSGGCNIIHLGLAPTPLLNFATHHLEQSDCGVMVTASHNPAEYNGFKLFFQHHALCGDEIKSLCDEMGTDLQDKSPGQRTELDISGDYLQAIVGDIVPAQGLKVVLDAGNGAAGELAVRLLEAIGCDVLPLYCDVDGMFPNHDPDPSVPSNLDDLKLWVEEQSADIGIALDGDGDRIVAVSSSGKIVWPDELLMIFARDVVTRHPGADVVFDIKSTRRLNGLISSYGGRPVMWKTGHSHMYNKIIESKAPLGGEYSGHIFFHDRWHGFDDGLYAAARLIEIMSIREQSLDDILAGFETRFATPEIRIPVSEETKFGIVEQLLDKEVFRDGNVTAIDGLRVDFPKAWGLVRASNTSPALTLRFEAESSDALEKIQSLFRQQLRSIDDSLNF
ncbi:MAG: phosphomannomutase/phosphoglucomutase [Gammaproteobacteria bacterium]|nr:MAG: phosphomannomutase/phosphoglucomutase [Gammaproteobacteria bacterium]